MASRPDGRVDAEQNRAVLIDLRIDDVVGAIKVRVTLKMPNGRTTEKTYLAGTCEIDVDGRLGTEAHVTLQYLNDSDEVVSAGDPFLIH